MDGPVLIIEDEKELAEILGEYLKMEGFSVIIAGDGKTGLERCMEENPCLVILDIMLPEMDGVEVCKRIRQKSEVPVLMLSAKQGELDKVICLGAGADDYVTKPFSPLELTARVKANVRRYTLQNKEAEEQQSSISAGRLTMYRDSYEAFVDKGKKLELTTKEFEMLYFFADHVNHVFSKEQIYHQVWGFNEYGDISSVAVYIKRIRTKLLEFQMDYIKTVWGAGYKMTV